ncbi:RNA polymerase sigma factor [Nakamurella lactea]|uniref:RNA polymerase sigma factor n=1 Tax=Nakamurella lactea TaxID=459515 RepID=UPI0009FDEEE0
MRDTRTSREGSAPGTGRRNPSSASLDDELVALARHLYGPAIALTSGDVQAAQDLVQDTVVALIPRWQDLGPHRMAYAKRALANRFTDHLRHSYVETAHAHTLVRRGWPDPITPSVDDRIDIQRALAHLAPRTNQVVILRYLVGIPAVEVSKMLEIPAGSVRRIAHEGLRQLAASLSPEESEGKRDE